MTRDRTPKLHDLRYRAATAIVLSLIAIVSATSPASSQEKNQPYYCKLYTNHAAYYAKPFHMAWGNFTTSQNAFNAFISSKYPGVPNPSFAHCPGPFSTDQAAMDAMNGDMSDVRRSGWSVVVTDWQFAGS